jgi:hypothetical protein
MASTDKKIADARLKKGVQALVTCDELKFGSRFTVTEKTRMIAWKRFLAGEEWDPPEARQFFNIAVYAQAAVGVEESFTVTKAFHDFLFTFHSAGEGPANKQVYKTATFMVRLFNSNETPPEEDENIERPSSSSSSGSGSG